MMKTPLQQRIQARIDALGTTARAASLKAGLGPDAIRIVLDGRSVSPRAARLNAIARALECDVRYLLGEAEDPGRPSDSEAPVDQAVVRLPIRYEVAAGLWQAVDDVRDEPIGFFPAPVIREYARFPQWVERVRGPSMNRLGIGDGSLVHVIDAVALGYVPKDGDIVVVTRTRAQGSFVERTVKQVETDGDRIELWGRSLDERYNVKLDYTAGLTGTEDDAVVEIVGKVVRAYLDFG